MIVISLLSLFAITANAEILKFPNQVELPHNFDPKIFGGIDAPDGAFPYMASLQNKKSLLHGCGASVLTANSVLTAAHCCGESFPETDVVYAGSQTLYADGNHYNISSVYIHPNNGTLIYDICIIKLRTALPLGPTLAQVTLPPPDLAIPDGANVTAIGWGYWDKPDYPVKLQMGTNYTALSQEKCNRYATQMCVYGAPPNQGPCFGDSGSPLLYNGMQVGIASMVVNDCGYPNQSIYCYVPKFISWIQEQLGDDAQNLKFD